MSIKNLITTLFKKTPLYSIYFRWRNFKNNILPEYKKGYRLYRIESIHKKGKSTIRKPEVVNLNANDICNSKCAMCNIWEQKQDFELSPADLGTLLKNPLFSKVRHIGITGGEPTLREDLPKLYEAAIKAIPNIVGLSIITNAIKEKDVIKRIDEVVQVCKHYNKYFSMMVSLDGYGAVHDKVRGRAGNFKSAENVINYFKNKEVNIAIGCTISKVNVWDVDELLFYMKKESIYGRFRVAEFIKRLYNEDKRDVIRNFDDDEIYHLMLFFHKLLAYEKNATYRRTYKSIINILGGGTRLTGCPYQKDGIVLNSRGEIAYCAPKSPVLGNVLKEDALALYENNLGVRREIFESDCDNCIHDYHAPETFKEFKKNYIEKFWKEHISLYSPPRSLTMMAIRPSRVTRKSQKQIMIVGWYGTETVGDKAILGGIIAQLNKTHGENSYKLVIASIYPFVTERTCIELNINAHIISSYSRDLVSFSKGSDIVIMGGGPLMDIEDLAIPLHAFRLAKKYGKRTIVYGCGLGPLLKQRSNEAVKSILLNSDEIKLRDNKSIDYAKNKLGITSDISLSGDPAKVYLRRYPIKTSNSKILRCYLREWTFEYANGMSKEEFKLKKIHFEKSLATFIKHKFIEINADSIKFEHMHNFTVGNDDRDFSVYFIDSYFKDWDKDKIGYNKYLSTVDNIVESMQNSLLNICMRFHSVVFAHTLETDFIAIDYTQGGKISNYLGDNDNMENMLTVDELIKNFDA